MHRRRFLRTLSAVTALGATSSVLAREGGGSKEDAPVPEGPKPISLLPPEKEGGTSVLAALWERKTNRSIREEKLPPQVLSNLLWAAFGVNRDKGPFAQPGRTAASASNSQEIDLYVALEDGIFLYEAVPHRLVPVLAGDHRSEVARRGRGTRAPAILIFVADIARFAKAPFQEPGLRDPEIQKSYYNVATGLIAGNVYVFAASQGLAAWFHNCKKEGLAKALSLRPDQRVLYAQTVGYPA